MDTSYLAQQVTTIIGKLHGLFDEIGVPSHDRDSRESELFSSLSETLHNHLRVVTNEKNELVEEAQRTITTIKQMEQSLEDAKLDQRYASNCDELKITYPLLDCLQTLKEKHRTVSKLHKERYEQVKKLVQALESYSSHLEPSFIQIQLPPASNDGNVAPTFDLSPSYINSVDNEFTRVYEEYNKRVTGVQQIAEEIVKLWAELGTPQAKTDTNIVKNWRDSPEQLGLHQEDMTSLRNQRSKLQEERRKREKRIQELRSTIEGLWDRLNIEQSERKGLLAKTRGCGLKAINDLEDELSRLNELKRQNLHVFVEDARSRLQTLWDELYFSEDEAVEFTPMFCEVYSDALLSAHEAEISRLEALKEQREPILQLVNKHRNLVKDREDLATSSQDASRLLAKGTKGERRDPGKLLREEKMRKRIAKELPKIEQELDKILEDWEVEYGRPFLVFGERYLDIIAAVSAKAAPPRSKTPNAMGPPSKTIRSAPKSAATSAAPSREASREPTTLRSKTPNPMGTLSRSVQHSSAKSGTLSTSPSKIPARVPLNSMRDGNNSPERQKTQNSPGKGTQQAGTKRNGPPMMAPPPKMRNIFPDHASTPSTTHSKEDPRSESVVRSVPPEDPYNDYHHNRHAQFNSSVNSQHGHHPQHSQRGTPQYHDDQHSYFSHHHHPSYEQMPPPPRPAMHHENSYDQYNYGHQNQAPPSSTAPSTISNSSRQISGSSSVDTHNTALSSENWETYGSDEEPEPEPDASEAYYAKLRAAQYGKQNLQQQYHDHGGARYAGEGTASMKGKTLKAFHGAGAVTETTDYGERMVQGSQGSWTTDESY